jgi:uncharacterized SAM-binding protein YcdF (DUF218 family)
LFALKKFIAFWLAPFPLSLVLLVGGLLLSRCSRRITLGRRVLAAGILLLVFLGNGPFANLLISPLERQYPSIGPGPDPRIGACDLVVVLGGGHVDDPALPAAGKLSSSELGRLVEGIRLLRMAPHARLVLSGPANRPGNPTHASIVAEAAVSLGVPDGRIDRIETARDTAEEAAAVRLLAGEHQVALVTSAWHMPRAAALFRKAGVNFIACPADFSAKSEPRSDFRDCLWSSDALDRSTRAVHEWLGCLWEKLIGKS